MTAPWMMWGTTQTIALVNSFNATSQQLVSIRYHRPDTWTFFFTAKFLSLNNANAGRIIITYDISFGVGRSQQKIEGFESYDATWLAGLQPVGLQWWSQSVIGIPRSNPGPDTRENIIREIPAQDIDLNVRASYVDAFGPTTEQAIVEVSAYFAPKVHVRPDWFEQQFEPGVLGGK